MFSVKVANPVPLKAPSVDAILAGLDAEPDFGLPVPVPPALVVDLLPVELFIEEGLVLHDWVLVSHVCTLD